MGLKAKRLREGDTIGVIAPANSASYIHPLVWERGVRCLERKGFQLRFGEHIMKLHGHTAGSVEERLEDLMAMFADPEVDAVMTVYGGHNSHQLLPYIDYDVIEDNPKAFVGFSDITSLNNAFLERIGLVNFSGPAFVTFCQPELPEYTERHFDRTLVEGEGVQLEPSPEWAEDPWWRDPEDQGGREWNENEGWKVLREGRGRGEVVGGNLSTFMLLAGTEYWPDLDGKVLFLEECNEECVQNVDRHFTHLRHLGAFGMIEGLVIGRPQSDIGFTEDDSLEMLLEEATKGYDIPIILNVDFGHTDPMITLPMGTLCEIDTDDGKIDLPEAAVR
jgi:muramoyltetrapeptide carboxypeptidase